MYKFSVDKSKLPELPIYPGDTFYWIDEGRGYEIVPDTVGAVVLGKNELRIIAQGDHIPLEIGKDYFLTYEAAEAWLAENKPDPPYVFLDDARKWMPYDRWLPYFDGYYMVRTAEEDETQKRKAYYDTGERNTEDRGFYTSKSRNAHPINNVLYWIDQSNQDTEEVYMG